MGVPPNHPFDFRIFIDFPWNKSSYWGTPIYKPPHFGSFQPLALDLLGQGQLPGATNLEGATSWIWARWTMVPAIKHIASSWSYFSLVIEYPKKSHTPQLHHVERAVTTCATRLTTVGHLAIGDLATQLGTRWVQFQWTISTCNRHMLARPFKLWHMWIVGCQMRTQTQTFEIPSWQTHLGSVLMSVCPLYGQQLTIKLPINIPRGGACWCAFFLVVSPSWPAAWRSNDCRGRNAPGFLERWRV